MRTLKSIVNKKNDLIKTYNYNIFSNFNKFKVKIIIIFVK